MPAAVAGTRACRASAHAMAAVLLLAAIPAPGASLNARDAAGLQWRALSDPADGAQGYVLERLAADGQLDPRFAHGGRGPLTISATEDAPAALRVDAQRRVWVTGADIAGGQPRAVILRYLPDGSPDRQWGVQGKVQVSPAGLAIKPNDLLPLTDGSVLVAGVAANLEPARAVVFHLKADGSLDMAFGTAGTWQRSGATDGSTATSLAASEDGAIAVLVAARGDHATAEIWSVADPVPRLVQKQPLDPDGDGESLRVAWMGGRWFVVPGSGSTSAGLHATLDPVAVAAAHDRRAAASGPSDPGQGGFSPFAAERERPSSPPSDAAVVHAEPGGFDVAPWLAMLAVVAVAGAVAIRRRMRNARPVLRRRNVY